MVKIPKMMFNFRQEGERHQIYIYDDVEEYGKFNYETWSYDESKTSAKYFQKKLAEIPEGSEIDIYINSNGGSVKEGTAIYNQLQRHKSYKKGIVDGVAHSIAFVILQACDHRIMGEGTGALVHEMWVATAGNAKQLRIEADQLDDWMEASRKLFMKRAKNITEEQLKELMEKETILTPDKALEYGLIDEVAGRREEASDEPMQAAEDVQKFREKMQNKEFGDVLKEFVELTEEKEKNNQVSVMDAFLNALM